MNAELDPYDVLGIKHTKSWEKIKNAYKSMLIKTHPDKMQGDARYFMLVHEAYAFLKKYYKHKNIDAPNEKQQYQVYKEQTLNNVQPKKMENFSNSKFNKYFEENRINDTYMNEGYGDIMCKSSKIREDDTQLKNTNLHSIGRQELIIYKEPEALNSTNYFQNCYELGIDSKKDYTGGGGVDYKEAYMEKCENIDTVKRFNSIQELETYRDSQNFALTKEEKKYNAKQLKKLEKLEQYRMQKYNNQNININSQYINLHQSLE